MNGIILFYIAFIVIAALISQRRGKRAQEKRSTQLQTLMAILSMFENGNITYDQLKKLIDNVYDLQ